MNHRISTSESGVGARPSGRKISTIAPELSAFDAPHMAAQLTCMSDAELDALPFGVIEMDHQFKVLRYNTMESRQSKLPPERVIGQHLFRDVSPWAKSQRIARRYQMDSLDETMQYTASLHTQEEPMTLRMIKPAYSERMYLLVNRS